MLITGVCKNNLLIYTELWHLSIMSDTFGIWELRVCLWKRAHLSSPLNYLFITLYFTFYFLVKRHFLSQRFLFSFNWNWFLAALSSSHHLYFIFTILLTFFSDRNVNIIMLIVLFVWGSLFFFFCLFVLPFHINFNQSVCFLDVNVF